MKPMVRSEPIMNQPESWGYLDVYQGYDEPTTASWALMVNDGPTIGWKQ